MLLTCYKTENEQLTFFYSSFHAVKSSINCRTRTRWCDWDLVKTRYQLDTDESHNDRHETSVLFSIATWQRWAGNISKYIVNSPPHPQRNILALYRKCITLVWNSILIFLVSWRNVCYAFEYKVCCYMVLIMSSLYRSI